VSKVAIAASPISRMELPIFFVVVGVIISGAVALVAATGDENFALIGVVLLGPSVTAVLLTALTIGRTGLRQLVIKQMTLLFGVQWYLSAFLAVPMIALVAIGLHTAFGGPDPQFFRSSLFPQIVFILVISLAEEFGWRGYALPRLQVRLNALQASLVLGVLWGFWHFPGFLIGAGVPLDMPFYVFMMWVLPATILITWVYNNSRSVVTAIAMHTSANFAFGFFPLIPEMTGTGELATFWVFLGVVWAAAIAVVIVFGPTHLSRTKPRATIAPRTDAMAQGSTDKLAGTIAA